MPGDDNYDDEVRYYNNYIYRIWIKLYFVTSSVSVGKSESKELERNTYCITRDCHCVGSNSYIGGNISTYKTVCFML